MEQISGKSLASRESVTELFTEQKVDHENRPGFSAHQKGAGYPQPSTYDVSGIHDGKVSMRMGGRPVFTMGHDGKVYGIIETKSVQTQPFVLPSPFGSLNYLLKGRSSFSKYIKNGNWEIP